MAEKKEQSGQGFAGMSEEEHRRISQKGGEASMHDLRNQGEGSEGEGESEGGGTRFEGRVGREKVEGELEE